MKQLHLYLVILLFLSFLPVYAEEFRIFTGSNGKAIEAQLLDYDKDNEIVHIRLKNGKEQRGKISLFSSADQEFIKNRGMDNPFESDKTQTNSKEVIRLTLHVDEFGEGKIDLEKTDKPIKDDFKGVPFNLSSFSKAKIKKGSDGAIMILHDFSNPDSFDIWGYQQMSKGFGDNIDGGVKINTDHKTLSMNPVPFIFDENNKSKISSFDHKGFFRLPVTIVLDIVSSDLESIRISLQKLPNKAGDFGRFLFNLNLPKDQSATNTNIYAAWTTNGKKEDIFQENNISFDAVFEKKFRIPGPNAKIDSRFSFSLSYGYLPISNREIKPLEISKMMLICQLVPMIGVKIGSKDSVVFAEVITPNKPADKAGLQQGDIIKSINGKIPKSEFEATSMIGEAKFGDEISISIERRGAVKTIKIKPDLYP